MAGTSPATTMRRDELDLAGFFSNQFGVAGTTLGGGCGMVNACRFPKMQVKRNGGGELQAVAADA
jgi:hypothetical protein